LSEGPLRIEAGPWTADIAAEGAELKRLQWKDRDLLWSGDPLWWGRTAPLLFPVVGAVSNGEIRVGERAYPMPKHGFARDLRWTVDAHEGDSLTLSLADSPKTRAHFPFAFRLKLAYRLGADGLLMTATLENPSDTPLPASFGFHPAFRWPLDAAHPKIRHRLCFEKQETAPLRRLEGDLMGAATWPSPVLGQELALHDDLFAHDALIFESLQSRSLRYGVPGGINLLLTWNLPHLGVWTKPGAPFLCLEPWQGFADPAGFSGEFADKPGQAILPPKSSKTWSCLISAEDSSE
jgi:galactose mutarotase-like enzyme